MFCSVFSLLVFVALGVAAFGVGRPLLRGINVPDEGGLATFAFSLGLGLTAAGLILLLLGWLGLICVPFLGALTLAGFCWGLVEIGMAVFRLEERVPAALRRAAEDWDACPNPPWPQASHGLLLATLSVAALAGTASLLGALTPPTSDTAISCQLESAKRAVVEHRIVEPADSQATPRPRLVDMWYVWAVAFDGGVGAQLFHWGLGVLLFLATVVLAEPLLGRPWALVAGYLVLLTPAVSQQMSLPTESVALAATCTLALAAWWRAVSHQVEPQWFVVAGISAGAALGTHGAAILLIAAVAPTCLWTILRCPEQRRFLFRGSLVVLLLALSIGILCRLPSRSSLASWMEISGIATSAGGPLEHLGMAMAAAAPGVLLSRRLRGLGAVVSVAVFYVLITYPWGGRLALLLPVVPLLSVIAVWVWIEFERFPRPARRLAAASFVVMVVCGATLSIARSPDAVRVALGLENRDDYLLRHEPTYSAASVANVVLRDGDHLLSQDPRAFYFDCRVTLDDQLARQIGGVSSSATVRERVADLRKAGFTHVLLVEALPRHGEAPASQASERLAEAAVFPLNNSRFKTADGGVRCYRLLSLR